MTAPSHFVYQRVHVLDGRILHREEHLRLAERALKAIYGIDSGLDISDFIPDLPQRGSAVVILRFRPGGPSEVELQRVLLHRGYAHSPLRPRGVTFSYGVPYAGFPTGFQLAATEFFDYLAEQHSGFEEDRQPVAPAGDGPNAHRERRASSASSGSVKSIRRVDNFLISVGDAPLFGIRGRQLFTASIDDGAMESVERQAVIANIVRTNLKLTEKPILHSELKSFDELFYADAAGITSLAECDGAKFTALVAQKLLPQTP